ncbi:hypothetical protein ISP15_06350 [Dyella jejuensis]|uniref:Uncharacterized protein n=1 Tax=Dyella jejuensis TaxID=1432009 RepID=A0ABW8JI68_9GAMM
MQILKLSVSLPDAIHPHMELRVSSGDSDCGVVIELPLRAQARADTSSAFDTPITLGDEYVLGGYAGI